MIDRYNYTTKNNDSLFGDVDTDNPYSIKEINYKPDVFGYVSDDIIDLQMFASPDDEGRTEDPTDYKKRKAREEGRVAKSQELTSAVMIIGMIAIMAIFGGYIQKNITDIFGITIGRIGDFSLTDESFPQILQFVFMKVLFICAPIFGVACLASLILNFAQVGFMFTTKPLEPKFDKIKPKFQRIFFSATTAFNLVKSILKVILIAGVLFLFINVYLGELLTIGLIDLEAGWTRAGNITMVILGSIALLFLGLAVLDFFYQKWDYKQNLKMSRYELKEERKDTEGDPHIKQRLREKMREITSQRMMEEVPNSDVVITNPTHFAVAVSYVEEIHKAPIVSAKGEDYLALRIKKRAKENDVPIVENKPLARALYDQVEIGDEIPEEFYFAVIEVLVYVYRLKDKFPSDM